MSVRTKVLGLVDVIMRVPPLLVIDEILKISMGLPGSTTNTDSVTAADLTSSTLVETLESSLNNDKNNTINASKKIIDTLVDDPEFYHFLSITTAKFIACLFGCFSAAFVFMLWTRHLVIVYMFIISVGLIFLSYWSNVSALNLIEDGPCLLEDILSLNVSRLLDPGGVAFSVLPHLIAQWFMGMLFAYIHLGPRHPLIQKLCRFVF